MTSNTQSNPNEKNKDNMPDSNPSIPVDSTIPSPIVLDEEFGDLALGKKRRTTSTVWNHFTREEVVAGDPKTVCNYCFKKLGGKAKNGTKHLHDHYKICMKGIIHDKKGSIQQKLAVEKTVGGKSQLVHKKFKQDVSRRELVNFVVLHGHPLSIVDELGFKRLLTSLQPKFTMVSRNSLRSGIFKIYDFEKQKTKRLMSSNTSRVGITTDMWTSQNQRRGYMVITAHWIDSNWKMQSRIIRFAYVPCPHTAEALCEVLIECFLDWNLDRKLSTLTVDNCSTNDSIISLALEKLDWSSLILKGEHFHMRCSAHILNLIVKDGMDIIVKQIEKIRDSVAYWRATPKREERFEEACRQLDITYSNKLVLDCKTRWNSTYVMLQTALLYRDVFPRLQQRESAYKCLPSNDEWELAKDMCERLELFHDVTKLFSGRQYPTANLLFPKLISIKLTLSGWLEDPNELVKKMAHKMLVKFDKYWLGIHGMMGVAAVLDPRFKQRIFDVYKGEEVQTLKSICKDMFLEYEKKYSCERLDKRNCNISSSCGSSTRVDNVNIVRFDDIFTQCVQPESLADSGKSELDLYFEERLHPNTEGFDILEWWKTNGSKYPIVSKMARAILAIPITTVASESAFSTSGRILDPYRSRLSPKLMEPLMCGKNWLWSEYVDEGESVASFYNALSNYNGGKDSDEE